MHYHARFIRDGSGRSPAQHLKEIVGCANSWRPRTPSGEPVPWEEVPYWPFYRPFYEIADRWETAQKSGELTPELADELQVMMYEMALALLGPRGGPDGERVTGRTTGIVISFENGRRLPESKIASRYC